MKNIEKGPNGALINIMSRMFRNEIKKECEKKGINATYYPIIMLLSRHPDGLVQSTLCDKTKFKPSTVSLTLKMLETLGYITRTPDELDLRKTIVKLTKEGEKLDEEIIKCFEVVERKLVKDITEDDLLIFRTVILQMIENIKDEEDICKC